MRSHFYTATFMEVSVAHTRGASPGPEDVSAGNDTLKLLSSHVTALRQL
jgi:hypothetical protein